MKHTGWGKAGLVVLVALTLTSGLAAKVESLAGLDFGPLEAREVKVFVPDVVTGATPVLIALDGQNMAAWRLEDALAEAARNGRVVPMVIAIPSSRNRLEEYGLAESLDFAGRGTQAAAFQRWVVSTLLPAVQARYALRLDPARTGVMGSSLGGLAAFDLAWRFPQVFGWAGIFSGSFWWRGQDGSAAQQQASRLAHRLVRESAARPMTQRLWFSAGTREETSDRDGNGVIDAVQDTTELIDELVAKGWTRGERITYVQLEGGEHNEASWARLLPAFLEWALPRRSGPGRE
ncbi:MAG TPA: alpha/beta hydrolase-fold protein [Lacunisphaera sp.]